MKMVLCLQIQMGGVQLKLVEQQQGFLLLSSGLVFFLRKFARVEGGGEEGFIYCLREEASEGLNQNSNHVVHTRTCTMLYVVVVVVVVVYKAFTTMYSRFDEEEHSGQVRRKKSDLTSVHQLRHMLLL
jgi:hypothetical protein